MSGLLPSEILNKNSNKWWDGWTNDHKAALIEDLDTDCLGHYLKIWADKYPFQAETKGSSKHSIRPKAIYITSNYRPD